MRSPHSVQPEVESLYAWLRLAAALTMGSIGTVGMWSVPVVMPAVQADFGVARADASLPFTLAMLGFAFGGVLMGRLTDRFGILAPLASGAVALGLGYVGAGVAGGVLVFSAVVVVIGVWGFSAVGAV